MYLKKKAMTEEELIKKIITVNCKPEFMWDFIRNWKKSSRSFAGLIVQINTWNKQQKSFLIAKKKPVKERRKWQENLKRERNGANMCWLKNHNHAWSEYPNNPISKNFSDKLYTEIPASEIQFWNKSRENGQRRKGSKEKSLYQEWWMPCYVTYGQQQDFPPFFSGGLKFSHAPPPLNLYMCHAKYCGFSSLAELIIW